MNPIMICTLRFSPNLGDGVIGDCVAHLVGLLRPGVDIVQFDLGGRTGFPASRPKKALSFRRLYYVLPHGLRPAFTAAAWPLFMRRKVRRAWMALKPAGRFDLMVGGGQVLSDVALNFPLKLDLVQRLAARAGARTALSAVGVTGRWSARGTRLFARALGRDGLVAISVRDEASRRNLAAHLPGLAVPVALTIDPGLWAAEVYAPRRAAPVPDRRRRVGIGIVNPGELAAHVERPEAFDADRLLRFWRDLARLVAANGHVPVLFTNGPHEDEDTLARLLRTLRSDRATRDAEALPRPTEPRMLVANIATLHAIAAHRLHANIVAHSLAIPWVALVWEDKVRAFAELARRDRWCLPPGAEAEDAWRALEGSIEAGVDARHLAALRERVKADIGRMLDRFDDRPAVAGEGARA